MARRFAGLDGPRPCSVSRHHQRLAAAGRAHSAGRVRVSCVDNGFLGCAGAQCPIFGYRPSNLSCISQADHWRGGDSWETRRTLAGPSPGITFRLLATPPSRGARANAGSCAFGFSCETVPVLEYSAQAPWPIALPCVRSRQQGVSHGCDYQGQQQAQSLTTDYHDSHRAALLSAGVGAQRQRILAHSGRRFKPAEAIPATETLVPVFETAGSGQQSHGRLSWPRRQKL
jgi:hypothetical protein